MAGEEKTEKATPKKRKDQRKEGNVLQSKEIGIAASVLGIFAAMRLLLGFISENIFSYTGSVFEELGSTYVTTDNIMAIWVDVIKRRRLYGRVVELVDSLDSGSSVHCGRAGSSPASPTKTGQRFRHDVCRDCCPVSFC